MGYPDIIAPIDDLPGLEYRADSAEICRRHGIPQRQIPDAESLFKCLKCTLDVFDIVRERGCEIEIDLNYPVPMMHWTGRHGIYDVVLDVGTMEHCFNIAQAVLNMALLVKKGGYIIHENPFLMGNHGFYSLNPTFYHDFYEPNGFKLIKCVLASKDGRAAEIPFTDRFKYEGAECNVFAMAQRAEMRTFFYPVQTKYAKLIPAAVDRAKSDADLRAIGA